MRLTEWEHQWRRWRGGGPVESDLTAHRQMLEEVDQFGKRLRAGLARNPGDLVQRPFHFAIVDEADSILIDEARVPLVIAGARESFSKCCSGTAAEPFRQARY